MPTADGCALACDDTTAAPANTAPAAPREAASTNISLMVIIYRSPHENKHFAAKPSMPGSGHAFRKEAGRRPPTYK